MRTTFKLLAWVGAVALSGCGGKSANEFEGTWKMDFSAIIEPQKVELLAQMKTQAANMKTAMAQIESLPADAKEKAMAQIWDAVPPENRDLAKAMMIGEAEASAAALKMLATKMGEMKADLVIKADNTFTMEMAMGPMRQLTAGEWKRDGASIVITPKTEDGKPATGSDAEPVTFSLKDGVLMGKPKKGGPDIAFRR